MSLSALVGGTSGPDGIPTGFFKDIFRLGSPFAQQAFGGIQPVANQLGPQLYGQGQQLLGGLAGAGQQLSPFMGAGFGAAQLGGLQSVLNQNFQENISPFIKSQAVGAGQLGGSRQIGELFKQAEANVQRPLFQFGGDFLQQDLLRRQQAAQAQGAQQIQAGIGGIGSLGSLSQLALLPFTAPFAPLQLQANLLSQLPSRPYEASGGILPALSGVGQSLAGLGLRFGGG